MSRQPSSRALLKFLSDVSMNVAGRKMVESISSPGRPGAMTARASSTPRVTSRVLAQGSFSTMSIRPGPPLMTASPIMGGKVVTTSATSARRSAGRPGSRSTGTSARSAAVVMAGLLLMFSRWLAVSMNPPVPMKPPSEKRSSPAARALEVVSITSSSVTPWVAMRSRSACTVSIWIRSPQMGTLATPGTCSSLCRIVQ